MPLLPMLAYCFRCVLAGAGIDGGITFGRSDKEATWPADRPVSCEDLACKIYHALGVDPHLLRDKQVR